MKKKILKVNKQINEKEEKNKIINNNRLITSKSYKNIEEINNKNENNKRTWRFSIKNKEENINNIPIQKIEDIKDKKLVISKSSTNISKEIKKEEKIIKDEIKDLNKKSKIQQTQKGEKKYDTLNNDKDKMKQSSFKININEEGSNLKKQKERNITEIDYSKKISKDKNIIDNKLA